MRQWHSLMAIGDSFTEGLEDRATDGNGYRGWADRLAEMLLALDPNLEYANLAVRGKLLDDIVTEQLPIALEVRPDLVTVCAGGNDLIVPGADIDELAAQFAAMIHQLRDNGSDVVIFTGPDVKHMPVVRAVRAKVALYNAHLWSIADQYGAKVVDLWGMRVLHDDRAWNDDRLHFSPEGHERIALRVAEILGAPVDRRWDTPWPQPSTEIDWLHLRQKDLAWARTHLLPWVRRQLRGESMGDGVTAKRPTLRPLTDEHAEHDLAG